MASHDLNGQEIPAETLAAYIEAVESRDLARVESYLDIGVPVDYAPPLEEERRKLHADYSGGMPGLALAFFPREKKSELDADLIELLLTRKADQSLPDAHNFLPIDYAACRENDRAFALLLEDAKTHKKKDMLLERAMVAAIRSKEFGKAEQILQAGGKITFAVLSATIDPTYGQGPVGGIDALRFLDRHHADFFQQNDKTGEGLLHLAAVDADPEILTFLLKKGLPANLRDHGGNTPLMVLAAGKRMNLATGGIDNAYSSAMGDRPTCADLMLLAGADKKEKNKEGLRAVDFLKPDAEATPAMKKRLGLLPLVGLFDSLATTLDGWRGGKTKAPEAAPKQQIPPRNEKPSLQDRP